MPQTNKEIIYRTATDNFGDNITTAMNELGKNEECVVLFGDIPFVKAFALDKLANTTITEPLVIPAIYEKQVSEIRSLHNLHFYARDEGYFQVGNAALIRRSGIERIDLEKIKAYYRSKSFIGGISEKLLMLQESAGSRGFAIATRHYISANLQHTRYKNIDRFIPAPKIETYRRVVSDILGIETRFMFGNFESLFLDFDYFDDALQLQQNWDILNSFMDHNTKP